MKRHLLSIGLSLAVALSGAVNALAQTRPIPEQRIQIKESSGAVDNAGGAEMLVWDQILDAGDAPWLRLRFENVNLPSGSYLLIASLFDGAVQRLDGVSIAQWYDHSAYFNGSAVEVSLYAAAGTVGNRVDVAEIIAGQWEAGDVFIQSQCGSTDDRVRWDEASRARLLNIGCSVAIYTTESCLITAGHCLQSSANVIEFNVPSSLSNGTLQHPGPEDQYSVDQSSREFTNGGVGNDWGLFRVFDNSNTGMQPYEAQGEHVVLDTELPTPGTQIEVIGYGVDSGVNNQTQQRSTGPVTSISGPPSQPALNHQADTEGGNSGSSIRSLVTNRIVAIHTHAGCNTSGTGSNASTGITHAGLQAALADYCAGGGGEIQCSEISSFNAVCLFGSRLIAVVRLTNSNHSGETVTITVDGTPFDVVIQGSRALLVRMVSGGSHVVSLITPPGCRNPITVNCN